MEVQNPDLTPLFNKVKLLIESYSKYFNPQMNSVVTRDLRSENLNTEFDGNKQTKVYFCGLFIQSTYLGFILCRFTITSK